jgi:hypothetical protein
MKGLCHKKIVAAISVTIVAIESSPFFKESGPCATFFIVLLPFCKTVYKNLSFGAWDLDLVCRTGKKCTLKVENNENGGGSGRWQIFLI